MRSLKDLGRLGKESVGVVYDMLYRGMGGGVVMILKPVIMTP